MPAITFDLLNQTQGFNFSKDVQDSFGFVTSLNVGGVDITADIKVNDPDHKDATFPVVGVFTKVDWSPGSAPGDPIEFNFQVSTSNKMFIVTLVHKTLDSIEVKIDFLVWDYDPIQKKYFKGLQNDGEHGFSPLKGL